MQIRYSRQAEKFLKKQPADEARRIRNAIDDLPAGDVKRLKGSTSFRLRVGNYRVIFDKNGNVIYISKIDSHGQVYK